MKWWLLGSGRGGKINSKNENKIKITRNTHTHEKGNCNTLYFEGKATLLFRWKKKNVSVWNRTRYLMRVGHACYQFTSKTESDVKDSVDEYGSVIGECARRKKKNWLSFLGGEKKRYVSVWNRTRYLMRVGHACCRFTSKTGSEVRGKR